jgi:hypothetical protein
MADDTAANVLSEIAREIAQAHAAYRRARQDALDHAKRAGDLLLQVNAHLRHGEFLAFIARCDDMSISSAYNYMRIAKNWSQVESARNLQRAENLSLRAALRIINESATDRSRPNRAPKVGWGDVPAPERRELRRIAAELENCPFVKHTIIEAGPGRGGDVDVVPGSAGAPVYWDIVGGDPEISQPAFKYTRTQVLDKVRTFVNTGKRSVVSDLAVDVAKRRVAGDRTLRPAVLSPTAGDVPTCMPLTVTMTMTEQQRTDLTCLLQQFDADRLLAVLEDAMYPQALEESELEGAAA